VIAETEKLLPFYGIAKLPMNAEFGNVIKWFTILNVEKNCHDKEWINREFQTVLKVDPDHQDVRYKGELLRKMLIPWNLEKARLEF
jgi:hypothetical protein